MILVCAATYFESGACAGAAEVEVLRTGVGPERAGAALARRLGRGTRPTLVVSSGFAGALSGPLPLHGCVTAGALFRLDQGRAVPVRLGPRGLRVAPGALSCALLSAGTVIRGGAPRLPTPAAADMESAALAEVASAAGIPFAVLRVVTDTASAPFPGLAADIAFVLASRSWRSRLAAAARAILSAVRSPREALALVRSSLAARRALASVWRGGAAGLLEPRPPRTRSTPRLGDT